GQFPEGIRGTPTPYAAVLVIPCYMQPSVKCKHHADNMLGDVWPEDTTAVCENHLWVPPRHAHHSLHPRVGDLQPLAAHRPDQQIRVHKPKDDMGSGNQFA